MSHANIVHTWFRENLAGGALAQNTEAYNQVHNALPKLTEALDTHETTAGARKPAKANPTSAAAE
jgi:hypothetical protein